MDDAAALQPRFTFVSPLLRTIRLASGARGSGRRSPSSLRGVGRFVREQNTVPDRRDAIQTEFPHPLNSGIPQLALQLLVARQLSQRTGKAFYGTGLDYQAAHAMLDQPQGARRRVGHDARHTVSHCFQQRVRRSLEAGRKHEDPAESEERRRVRYDAVNVTPSVSPSARTRICSSSAIGPSPATWSVQPGAVRMKLANASISTSGAF